jgi:protein TonB
MKSKLILLGIFLGIATVSNAQLNGEIPASVYYKGGQVEMLKFLKDSLVYPPMAKRNRTQGTCIVDFILGEDGKILEPKCVKNIGAGCGEAAITVVKKLKFNAPGFRVKNSIPVVFKLN